MKSQRKPKGYWDDFANVERELREFIAQYGVDGVMPTQKELAEKQRNDLVQGIGKHGGISAVARQLKLTSLNVSKPAGYWNDFNNVEKELLDFIEKQDLHGIMPTRQMVNVRIWRAFLASMAG
jgi:hypothetical protein